MTIKAGQTSVLAGMGQNVKPCVLTWYDPALGGINTTTGANPHAATASGEPYDPNAMTCAAPPQYPFGTVITFQYNGKSVACKVNDRGGAIKGSHFDLSRGAARALGMIGVGMAQAYFFVGGIAGTANQATDAAQANSGPDVAGGAVLRFGSFFSLAASDVAQFLFDAFIKFPVLLIADYVIVPLWHWNQRAVVYYQQNELFADNTGLTQLANIAFWSFGYVLLWGNSDATNLKELFQRGTPTHRSILSKHVRTAQSLPEKRKLFKPKDVGKITAVKPQPKFSRANIIQVGTMSTTRPHRVTIHGHRADRAATETEARLTESKRINLRETKIETASSESDASNRTGVGTHQTGRKHPSDSSRENGFRRR